MKEEWLSLCSKKVPDEGSQFSEFRSKQEKTERVILPETPNQHVRWAYLNFFSYLFFHFCHFLYGGVKGGFVSS